MFTKMTRSSMSQTDLDEFSLFENFEEAVFVMAPDGMIRYANKNFSARFGKQPCRCIGVNIYDMDLSLLKIPLFTDETKHLCEEVIRTGKHAAFETDKNEKKLRLSIYPFRPADTKDSGLLVIVQDVTVQRRMELEARKGKAILDAIVDTIPASVIIIDSAMKLVGWNRFSRDNINGKSEIEMSAVNPFGRVHPDDLSYLKRLFFNVIKLDVEETAEFRMFHKDGPPYKWATLRAKKVIIDDKPCVVAVVTETTELKQAEEWQKKTTSELEQAEKMELLGELAVGIAHDFNNSLTAILGNTELLLQQIDPSLHVNSNIKEIQRAAIQSAKMTRKLLDFARKQSKQPEIILLDQEIGYLLPLLKRMIGEHVRFVWSPDGENARVRLDPCHVDQIITNLCINARDALSGNGTITIATSRVQLSSADCQDKHPELSPGEYVRLSVSDTGNGIDQQTLPHIFEPFFTTKPLGNGTGLGLSMIYGTLKQNNGAIECKSDAGKGTAFHVYLPECREQQQDNVPVSQETIPTSSNETVLLVEDEPYILKIVKEVLENKGFKVLAAEDAETAIRLNNRHRDNIALLITDVMLPDTNGVQLSRKLQTINPEMKVLFMSGYAHDVIGHYGRFEKGVDFIQKPFPIDEFLRVVYRTLSSVN
jgi:PAS domain S-box-containing protein